MNDFLKLELFSQTLPQCLMTETSIGSKASIEQYLNQIKETLLTQSYRRKSL